MKLKLVPTFLALTILVGTTVVMASDQQTIKVGKTGEIVFSSDTWVGNVLLKAGHYKFQHRAEGTDHFVHFTELKMTAGQHRQTGFVSGERHPGEIKCQVEPLNRKVSETAIYTDLKDGKRMITRIEVAGENVAHAF